jgi:hypothetical protein
LRLYEPPTHHTCEGVVGMQVEQGHFENVSLDGVKWAVAFHWPGPLHEGNGTVKPYFDPSQTAPGGGYTARPVSRGPARLRWRAAAA